VIIKEQFRPLLPIEPPQEDMEDLVDFYPPSQDDIREKDIGEQQPVTTGKG